MEAYGKVLLIAIPMFFVLILIETAYGWWRNKQTFNQLDTISSLSSGITNTLFEIMGLGLVVISYDWLVNHIALFTIQNTIMVYVLSFIAIDFAGYCNHRLNHSVNYFWNIHIIHHSSEEFNLACALRQSISNVLSIGAFFLIPAAIIGIPTAVIAVIAPLHLFMQFWYHTKHIGKLGWLEYIIVTPSQHRVHHAINDIYIDKNMGQIFSIWDRLFGTFQEELDSEPCVYGVLKPVRTWNPIKINFQHLAQLAKDAWHTTSYRDKLRIWFMPTGWRPADVQQTMPIAIINNPHDYDKYVGTRSKKVKIWSWFQFILTNILVVDFLLSFTDLGFERLSYYGLFVFVLVYSYSSLMDQDKYSPYIETVKSALGLYIIYHFGEWFLIDNLCSGASYGILIYLFLSPIIVAYLSKTEILKDPKNTDQTLVTSQAR